MSWKTRRRRLGFHGYDGAGFRVSDIQRMGSGACGRSIQSKGVASRSRLEGRASTRWLLTSSPLCPPPSLCCCNPRFAVRSLWACREPAMEAAAFFSGLDPQETDGTPLGSWRRNKAGLSGARMNERAAGNVEGGCLSAGPSTRRKPVHPAGARKPKPESSLNRAAFAAPAGFLPLRSTMRDRRQIGETAFAVPRRRSRWAYPRHPAPR